MKERRRIDRRGWGPATKFPLNTHEGIVLRDRRRQPERRLPRVVEVPVREDVYQRFRRLTEKD